MAVEYPGVVEFWNQEFSVHAHPSIPGQGAYFWVGDEDDTGGLFVTARDNGGGTNSYVMISADRFTHASHGSINFAVRNPTDSFKFDVGPFGQEVMAAQISGTGTASALSLISGPVQAVVSAQSSSPSGVALGAASNSPASLVANAGAAQATLYPSGNFSLANAPDTAPLAVGNQGQFQVSATGAATIGGGTPIMRHLSVLQPVTIPNVNPGLCATVSVSLAGAVDGDSVVLGVPNELASVDGLTWSGWVSAYDTVTVRFCNMGSGDLSSNPTVNLRVDDWQH